MSGPRRVQVWVSEMLALVAHAADAGVTLPDFVQDQLGLWLEHVTDAELEAAVETARELAPDGRTAALGALRRWRRAYCPRFDGVEDRTTAWRGRAGRATN